VLARYVLDHPGLVRSKRVLDFGGGCAIEAIAAARCGAHVHLTELDPRALDIAARNATANDVTLTSELRDVIEAPWGEFDVILAGDVCYEPALAVRVVPWLERQASRGVRVLVGDPLRVPGALDGWQRLATFDASFDGDPRGLTRWPTHVLTPTPVVP
jgi:predicted nicotinamide N-methyase